MNWHSLIDDSPVNNNSTSNTQVDFNTMSAEELSNYAMNNPDWYSQNSALVDYWLGEKSYYNRASQNIKSQYEQLKALGVNPVLAMSLLGNVGSASLSGGQESSSSSYFATKYSANKSEESSILKTLLGVGILAVVKLLLK